MTKDEWITDFATELSVNIRPELGPRHTRRIAVLEWASRKDTPPSQAAKQWAAEQEARRKAP